MNDAELFSPYQGAVDNEEIAPKDNGCQTADCYRLERRFEIGGFEACAAQSGRRMRFLIG